MRQANRVLDALNNASLPQVGQFTLSLVDRLQALDEDRVGEQIAASACLFLLLCERFRVDPADAFRAASKIMAQAKDQADPFAGRDFEAVRMYLAGELR